MVGMGMIFDETYRPFFERVHRSGLYDRTFGVVEVPLVAVAIADRQAGRGVPPARRRKSASSSTALSGEDAIERLLHARRRLRLRRHARRPAFRGGPTGARSRHASADREAFGPQRCSELDELVAARRGEGVLAKVVYHKLLDPDHKKLRTLVRGRRHCRHVNNGYCTLLEPKQISGSQFAEWITGRNPGTYVAVHYIKLIDFTFGGRLKSVTAPASAGSSVRPTARPGTATQTADDLRVRRRPRGGVRHSHLAGSRPTTSPATSSRRCSSASTTASGTGTAASAASNARSKARRRSSMKISINNHYNGTFLEPWGERSQRGYGVEVIERFVREVAFVEFGGDQDEPGAIVSS